MSSRKTTTRTGQQAETTAENYLVAQGLKVITRNFRCRFGEIDLIAIEHNTLVFVEVRYRRTLQHMAVIETLDKSKIQRLITTGEYFLGHNRQYQKLQCRFDFIGISGNSQKPEIEWIKNAFQA